MIGTLLHWLVLLCLGLSACPAPPERGRDVRSAAPPASQAPAAVPTAASLATASASAIRTPEPAAPTALAPTPLPPTPLPRLDAEWLERIELEDTTVVVTPPVGARTARSVLVGVHGAGDRADWSCGGWRLASEASVFVVCPQGSRQGAQSFAWASARQMEARIESALAAARRRFGKYMSEQPMIYAGFSQGATLAEPFLRKNAARFPIAILAEGGYATAQSASFARAFREAGGRRIALVCGSSHCFAAAARAQRTLESAGLESLVVGDSTAGHNLNDRMQKALQRAWPAIAAALPTP